MDQNMNNLNNQNNEMNNNQPLNNNVYGNTQQVNSNVIQQPIMQEVNVSPVSNERKSNKSKVGLIIGVLLVIVIGIGAFLLFNKKGDLLNGLNEPDDAADSVIKKVKTPHGDFYIKENVKDFVKQFHDYKTYPEALGLGEFDKELTYKSSTIDFFDKDDWAASSKFLSITIKTEDDNFTLGNYKLTDINVTEGTIVLKNGNIELDKTTIDEAKKLLGENNLSEKKDYLELYTFEFNEHKWNQVRVYCQNGIVSNIAVSIES